MRITAGISSIERQLLGALAKANAQAALASLRLSTSRRINRPVDDPAGYLHVAALEREQAAVQAAITRVDAVANVAAQLQLNIEGVRTQLNTVREALLEDADQSLNAEQRAVQQAIVDDALQQIDRLAGATISGRRMLDGSAGYTVTGRNPAEVSSVQVYSARDTSISGQVTTAATQATLTYTGAAGQITSTAAISVGGQIGTASISVTAGQTLASAAASINAVSHETGVTAEVAGNTLTFRSVEYGSEETVAVVVQSGTFNVTGGNGDGTANGTEAVVTINGMSPAEVSGNRVTFANNGLHFDLELVAGFTGTIDTMTISQGSTLQFVLGPDMGETLLAVPSVLPAHLGGVSGRLTDLASGGSLSGLGTNTSQAIRVVDEALGRLDLIQGRIDAFAGITVGSSAQLLDDWDVQLASALESANGIDEEVELTILDHQQNLASNAIAALALLQQQQATMVTMLQQLAGLR
jgi:flagellin-like hook-associated protein FlgL